MPCHSIEFRCVHWCSGSRNLQGFWFIRDHCSSLQFIIFADGNADILHRSVDRVDLWPIRIQVLRADLILIDETGFAPMDDTGAQLFFDASPLPTSTRPSASRRTGP
jgi:hypothetical protein